MRRVGNQDLGTLAIPARLVISAYNEHTGQFAVSASGRLQGHPSEPADLLEHFLQLVHQ